MREGNKVRVRTLRLLNAALLELEKSGKKITAAEEQRIVLSSVKKRREAIGQYRRVGREDLAAQEEEELRVLEEYLPPQLSPEQIEGEVQQIIKQIGAEGGRDFGRVMQIAIQKLRERVDGKTVQQIVRRLLEQQ